MNERPRKPAAFRLDDPDVRVATDDDASARGRTVLVTPEPEPQLPVPAEAVAPLPRRRWRWGSMFWSACGGLALLGLGVGVARLVEDLFGYSAGLGYLGLALAAAAVLALLVVAGRETFGLLRLATVEKLQSRATEVLVSDDRNEGRAVVRELIAFERVTPRLAHARAGLEGHLTEIIDGADLIRLAERELMGPLDAEARRMVMNAAKRVSLVTAVSPRAAVDLLFVLFTALTLMRALARLYGSRPGTLGMVRLFRLVLGHLAMTGGMAAGDSLISQMLGHGVAARVSARLGEGVLNGLLTARLGIAAIEVTRPLPFTALPPPALNDLAGELLRTRKEDVREERPGGG
jgi:putative membrane protein